MVRNDIHTPSALIPADYQHVLAFAYAGADPLFDPSVNVDVLATMRSIEKFFNKPSGKGGCDVCGAHFRYGSVFVHVPTNEHICVGWECAEKIESLADMQTSRNEVMSRLASRKAKLLRRFKLKSFVMDAGKKLLAALRVKNATIRSIRESLIQWGSLTQPQQDCVLRIAARIAEQATEIKVPAPEGTIDITGQIVSIKMVDNQYGNSYKMTVKVPCGEGVWLLWTTLPASIHSASRGDQVKLTANVTRSDRDPSFAFGKRPRAASIIN